MYDVVDTNLHYAILSPHAASLRAFFKRMAPAVDCGMTNYLRAASSTRPATGYRNSTQYLLVHNTNIWSNPVGVAMDWRLA
jgi:hypothetical protein